MAQRSQEQQAIIEAATQRLGQSMATANNGNQLSPRQMEIINSAIARLDKPETVFASPVIDERFYKAGQQAEDLSVRPDIADVDPMALSEGGINVGTPEGREMATRLGLRGYTLGLSEPAGALTRSLATGRPFSEQLAQDKAAMEAYKEAIGPAAAIATEVAGGVQTPFSLLKAPKAIQQLGQGKQAAIKSVAAGGLYGFATGEGGVAERGQEALEVAIPSALFGVATEKVIAPVLTKTLATVTRQNSRAPTIESLRRERDLAYKQADEVETLFGVNDYERLIANASKRLEGEGYVPEVDNQVRAAINLMTAKQGQVMTLKEMDKLRQGLWRRWKSGNDQEKRLIREIIDEMDDTIESQLSVSQNEALTIARESHKRAKKAELIDEAFQRAQRQAAATGSGGNVENLYRQAVNRILNGKDARYFTPAEKQAMEKFIKGDFTQNLARLLGKLSPSGNGLMMALNIGAVATDPTFVLATIAGASSKAFADQRVKNEAQKIIDMMARGTGNLQKTLGIEAGPSAIMSKELAPIGD